MSLKAIIEGLAAANGISEDEGLKALLENETIKGIEVPEELKTKLIGNLYTKDAAKNDKEIQDFYYSKIQKGIYDNVNDVTDTYLSEFKLPEDVVVEINKDDSPLRRLKTLLNHAKSVKPEKVQDNAQLEKLNNEIKAMKEAHEAEIKSKAEEVRNQKLGFLVKTKVFKENLVDPPGGKEYLAKALYDKLSTSYHLDTAEDDIIIKQKEDPTMDVFENNEKLTFDKVLSKELQPFIKKNDEPIKPHERRKFEPQTKPKTYHDMIRQNAKSTSMSM